MLELKNLEVSFKTKKIVKDVSLELKRGELIVLMGPNASGKSTLVNAVSGDPDYIINKGDVFLDSARITTHGLSDKVKSGLFVVFQNPVGIPGVSVTKIFREVKPALFQQPGEFMKQLRQIGKELNLTESLFLRSLNIGFSGGEKKKMEFIQAYFLANKYLIIDEVDAGLDADSIKKIALKITELLEKKIGILLITHSTKLTKLLKVSKVLVMKEGRVIKTGKRELIDLIDKYGYSKIENT
jgi:Fe-S cluster assembly ATP-binding protein